MPSPSESPGVKQEPDDGRVLMALPTPNTRPHDARVRLSSADAKQEPEDSVALPLRPASSPIKSEPREPGEIDSSPAPPPFPRALNEATNLRRPSSSHSQSSTSSRNPIHHLRPGPIPQQGSPQDRFRQAMMGLNTKKENKPGPANEGRLSVPATPRRRGAGGFGGSALTANNGSPMPVGPRGRGAVGAFGSVPTAYNSIPSMSVGPQGRGNGVFGRSAFGSVLTAFNGAPTVPLMPLGPQGRGTGIFGNAAPTANNGGMAMLVGPRGRGAGGPLMTGPNAFPVLAPNVQPQANRPGTTGFGTLHHDPNQLNPGPLAALSHECQRRKFNPEWYGNQTNGGIFTCNVKLGGQVVKGDGHFPTLMAAKIAVAKKALRIVQAKNFKVTRDIAPQGAGAPVAATASMPKQMGQNSASGHRQSAPVLKKEEDTPMPDIGGNGATAQVVARRSQSASRRSRAHEQSERASLLDRVHRMTGISLPESARNNPDVARAFLEGLSVGARLSGSVPRRRHSRSRSPSAHRHSSESYRERSPGRNRDRNRSERRTRTDYYRPAYSDVREDVNFGRLSRED